MTKREIEMLALQAVERARRGEQAEDSYIEFKRQWPLPADAARSIAGLCNAARGAPALLLVGVDETGVVHGASDSEGSNWKQQLNDCFEGVAPEALAVLTVPVGERSIVAIHFETDRSPYVIRRYKVDPSTQDRRLFEVPWREMQSTRSARREDLLRLLNLHQPVPAVELIDAELDVSFEDRSRPGHGVNWVLRIKLYLIPRTRDRVVIPFHRCECRVDIRHDSTPAEWYLRLTEDLVGTLGGSPVEHSRTLHGTQTELIVDGPGCCRVLATSRSLAFPTQPVECGVAEIVLGFAHSAHTERIRFELGPGPERKGQLARWICTASHPRAHLVG